MPIAFPSGKPVIIAWPRNPISQTPITSSSPLRYIPSASPLRHIPSASLPGSSTSGIFKLDASQPAPESWLNSPPDGPPPAFRNLPAVFIGDPRSAAEGMNTDPVESKIPEAERKGERPTDPFLIAQNGAEATGALFDRVASALLSRIAAGVGAHTMRFGLRSDLCPLEP